MDIFGPDVYPASIKTSWKKARPLYLFS
jgi:hypothetical protein